MFQMQSLYSNRNRHPRVDNKHKSTLQFVRKLDIFPYMKRMQNTRKSFSKPKKSIFTISTYRHPYTTSARYYISLKVQCIAASSHLTIIVDAVRIFTNQISSIALYLDYGHLKLGHITALPKAINWNRSSRNVPLTSLAPPAGGYRGYLFQMWDSSVFLNFIAGVTLLQNLVFLWLMVDSYRLSCTGW